MTDERDALAETIRDLARRECGTREQRDCLTHGGHDEHLVHKVLPMTIYAGTSEIQREIIGSTFGP